MRTVHVTDPARIEWAVRVVWAPRHRALFRRIGAWRRNKKSDSNWDFPDPGGGFGGDGCGTEILFFLLFILALVLAWWLVIPLLLLLLDGLIVFFLLLIGLGARILLRRPWTVEATSAAATHSVEITGWKRALRARDGIANGIKTGGAAAWPSLVLRRWD